MIEYIKGKLVSKTAAQAVVETAQGVAYMLNVSLATSAPLQEDAEIKLFTHQVIKEDAHLLYGFLSESERAVFRRLISVSGVGATSASTILSTRSPKEITEAIILGDSASFKAVKGIGAKTAEKIVIELKDKMGEILINEQSANPFSNRPVRKEAIEALEVLGISRFISEKIVGKLIAENNGIAVEELIKLTLRQL